MNKVEERHFEVDINRYPWAHAEITKDIAMGFDTWIANNCKVVSDGRIQWRTYNDKVVPQSELYDIYVEQITNTP